MSKSPFILKHHEETNPKVQELKAEELGLVSGAGGETAPTITSTPDGDGGDDGSDEIDGGGDQTKQF